MSTTVPPLSDAARLGPVHLRVTDIDRSARIWTEVAGLEGVAKGDRGFELRAGRRTLLTLREGARFPASRHSEGLFHVALALPSRLELARAARRLHKAGLRPAGQDHLISESVYFADPDGIGVELYVPTPDRASVQLVDGEPVFRMKNGASFPGILPLDMRDLLRETDRHGEGDGAMPADTRVGHVHFRSNTPEAAMTFYTGIVGFAPHIASTSFGMFDCGTPCDPHLVAFNTWGGRQLVKASRSNADLAAFTIELPFREFDALRRRVTEPSSESSDDGFALEAPDGTLVRFRPRDVADA